MNIAAAALSMALCTFAGYMRSYKIEERKNTVSALLSDCMTLQARIDYTAEPLAQVLKGSHLSPETKRFWDVFIYEINRGNTCSAAWERAYSDTDVMQGVLTDDEIGELDSFFRSLGRADRTGERKNLDLICSALKKACDRLDETVRVHTKMCRSLGALAGLGLAILII